MKLNAYKNMRVQRRCPNFYLMQRKKWRIRHTKPFSRGSTERQKTEREEESFRKKEAHKSKANAHYRNE